MSIEVIRSVKVAVVYRVCSTHVINEVEDPCEAMAVAVRTAIETNMSVFVIEADLRTGSSRTVLNLVDAEQAQNLITSLKHWL